MLDPELKDKVALVTGGNNPFGIGAAIRKRGGKAESWDADLREPDNADRLFERAERTFGQVDILVNNAADYLADIFLPTTALGQEPKVWNGGHRTALG